MRYLLFVLLMALSSNIFAQLSIKQASEIVVTEEYKNVKTIPYYTDENSSVFVIFVKQSVRKHLHQYHTEVITVLEGTADFYLGGDKISIKKGDHIVIPPGVPHAVITTSGKPLKVISVQSPEFLGEDRVYVEDETQTAVTKTTKEGTKKTTNSEEEEESIPEYD